MNMKSFVAVVLCLLFLNVSIAAGIGEACKKNSDCINPCPTGSHPVCFQSYDSKLCACSKD